MDDTLTKIDTMAAALQHASGQAQTTLQREYLELVGQFLVAQGRGAALANPLLDLIDRLEPANASPVTGPSVDRRGRGGDASEEMLAHAAAVIDVLVSAGYSSDNACQIVTRQMIARRITIPTGGDARAWRNIQSWRHRLLTSKRDGAVWRAYADFKDELPKLYGSRLAEAAARDAIWDRRSAAEL
jgi:hypothetical protein